MAFVAPLILRHRLPPRPSRDSLINPVRMKAAMKASNARPAPLHVESPLIESPVLSKASGNDILLKLDNLQPGGSFKIRGHGHLLSTHVRAGKHHFISSSGGNAGMAVAVGGRALGVRVTIVVPESTPEFMIARLRREDAHVVVHGAVWDVADMHARQLVQEDNGAVHVSPFDDALLWAGHASLVDELAAQLAPRRPSAVVVSVGGGGLLLGVVTGLRNNGWEHVPVVAAETRGADSFAQMAHARKVVTLDGISSIAKSLGALSVSEACVDVVNEAWPPVQSVVVSDREAVEACSALAVHHRFLVEPACGAAIAAAMKLDRRTDGPVVVVVCGGNMASPSLLAEWVKVTGATEANL